jgi:hypothetical protein
MPLTVGFLGVQVRPVSAVGLGASVDFLSQFSGSGLSIESDIAQGKKAKGETRAKSLSPYINLFPSESSHFFLGLGLVKLENASSVTLDGVKYSYTSKSTYVRPALGWNWIWMSGFSLFLDLGVGFQLSHERDESGLTTDNARTAATHFDEKYHAPKVGFVGGGSGLLGWSFGF